MLVALDDREFLAMAERYRSMRDAESPASLDLVAPNLPPARSVDDAGLPEAIPDTNALLSAELWLRTDPAIAQAQIRSIGIRRTPLILSGLAAGEYAIRVFAEGYKPEFVSIDLAVGERRLVELVLSPIPTVPPESSASAPSDRSPVPLPRPLPLPRTDVFSGSFFDRETDFPLTAEPASRNERFPERPSTDSHAIREDPRPSEARPGRTDADHAGTDPARPYEGETNRTVANRVDADQARSDQVDSDRAIAGAAGPTLREDPFDATAEVAETADMAVTDSPLPVVADSASSLSRRSTRDLDGREYLGWVSGIGTDGTFFVEIEAIHLRGDQMNRLWIRTDDDGGGEENDDTRSIAARRIAVVDHTMIVRLLDTSMGDRLEVGAPVYINR